MSVVVFLLIFFAAVNFAYVGIGLVHREFWLFNFIAGLIPLITYWVWYR